MARIVIADDDADIRELVVFKLRHGGHDVVPVGDGAAAVEACTAEKPDLVILDVMMPGMSGLDAARALRADSSRASRPAPTTTSSSRSARASWPRESPRCWRAAADHWLRATDRGNSHRFAVLMVHLPRSSPMMCG
jgi:two-component system, OmpR family, response regulator MtrA